MVHSSEEQIDLGSTSGRIIHGHPSTIVGLPRKSAKCSLFSLKAATLVARRLLILFHDEDHPLSLCFFFFFLLCPSSYSLRKALLVLKNSILIIIEHFCLKVGVKRDKDKEHI